MLSKEELINTPEYWMELIQNEIYFELKKYMEDKGYNQTELANELGFTKGYISQVLHGNFNHSTKKLIELALAIGKAPEIRFNALSNYLERMNNNFEPSQLIMEPKSLTAGEKL